MYEFYSNYKKIRNLKQNNTSKNSIDNTQGRNNTNIRQYVYSK